MIRFSYQKDEKLLEIKGHALFDETGKDIVCAGVSAIVYFSINYLELMNELSNVDYQIEEASFKIKVLNETKSVKGIIDNILYTLKDLSKSYPQNIKKEG